jgi:hypothetical protein
MSIEVCNSGFNHKEIYVCWGCGPKASHERFPQRHRACWASHVLTHNSTFSLDDFPQGNENEVRNGGLRAAMASEAPGDDGPHQPLRQGSPCSKSLNFDTQHLVLIVF